MGLNATVEQMPSSIQVFLFVFEPFISVGSCLPANGLHTSKQSPTQPSGHPPHLVLGENIAMKKQQHRSASSKSDNLTTNNSSQQSPIDVLWDPKWG
jgi:hypothetical protein